MPAPEALDLLHLDDHVCVVDKPSGLMVHRTSISRDRTFLADLLRDRLGRRIWTVHRLDRATSGVLMVALSADAARELGRQFEAGAIGKQYLAVVRGWIDEAGLIERPLCNSRGRLQEARTRFRRIATAELPLPVPPHETARYSLVDLRPETGRRHQLRRHLNRLAHPIVGDVNHGDRRHNRLFRAHFGSHRLLLHAKRLEFAHPANGQAIAVEVAPPENFRRVLDALGWSKIGLRSE